MKIFDKLFSFGKSIEYEALTLIKRTEVIDGFSVPGIIKNSEHYYTNLEIYHDGMINCWGMVDLSMFKEKLAKNWVVTSIPNGEVFSVSDLGRWKIEEGVWLHSKDTFYEYVYSLVKSLNPSMENLHNYHGSDTKLVGKVNFAKHSSPNAKPFYSEKPKSIFPARIDGEKINIFFRSSEEDTYLSELSIYGNGLVEVSNLPQKQTFRLEELENLSDNGVICTEPKIGEKITILNLGSFKITSGSGVSIGGKLNEITDKFHELNGRENSIARCTRIFEEYKSTPTTKLKAALEAAYGSIPEHLRMFVGTMDTKDYEVRQAIYGDIVKNEWQEKYGYEYPFDDMPKPVDA